MATADTLSNRKFAIPVFSQPHVEVVKLQVPQFSSSDPSAQSLLKSHTKSFFMQCPRPQWKNPWSQRTNGSVVVSDPTGSVGSVASGSSVVVSDPTGSVGSVASGSS